MGTLALPLEQGRQIIQHLNDLEGQLSECLEKWSQTQKKTDVLFDDDGVRSRERYFRLRAPEDTEPSEIEFEFEMYKLSELSDQVKEQVEQGHVEKQLLLKLNEKLGDLQTKYGNILVFSATVAAIISGLKDLIDMFIGK